MSLLHQITLTEANGTVSLNTSTTGSVVPVLCAPTNTDSFSVASYDAFSSAIAAVTVKGAAFLFKPLKSRYLLLDERTGYAGTATAFGSTSGRLLFVGYSVRSETTTRHVDLPRPSLVSLEGLAVAVADCQQFDCMDSRTAL